MRRRFLPAGDGRPGPQPPSFVLAAGRLIQLQDSKSTRGKTLLVLAVLALAALACAVGSLFEVEFIMGKVEDLTQQIADALLQVRRARSSRTSDIDHSRRQGTPPPPPLPHPHPNSLFLFSCKD